MAETVETLKATVAKLEQKIEDLEGRLQGKLPSGSSDSMRMILIGPPGAGMSRNDLEPRPNAPIAESKLLTVLFSHRQGNTST